MRYFWQFPRTRVFFLIVGYVQPMSLAYLGPDYWIEAFPLGPYDGLPFAGQHVTIVSLFPCQMVLHRVDECHVSSPVAKRLFPIFFMHSLRYSFEAQYSFFFIPYNFV